MLLSGPSSALIADPGENAEERGVGEGASGAMTEVLPLCSSRGREAEEMLHPCCPSVQFQSFPHLPAAPPTTEAAALE